MNAGNPLADRLSWCGRLIIATLAVAAVSFVARLDAKDWQLDYDLLSLVEHTNSRVTSETVLSPRAERLFGLFMEKDADEEGGDPPVARYKESRRKLAEWLSDCGVRGAEDPGALLSPDRKGGPTFCLYRFVFDGDERRALWEIPREDDLVDLFLKRHGLIIEGNDAEHVVGLKEPLPVVRGADLPPLRAVRLGSDGIRVEFGRSSSGIPEEVVTVEVEVVKVTDVPIYAVVPDRAKLGFSAALHTLKKHGLDMFGPKQEERLRSAYGGMPMSLAKSIAAGAFLDAYGKVNIFGFAFSARRFPFVIATALVALSVAVAFTVRSARKGSGTLTPGSGDAATADAFLRGRTGRAFLWVLAPLAAIGLSLPFGVFGPTDYYWAGAAGIVVTVMGLSSLAGARKL